MRQYLFTLSLLIICSSVYAKEYGNYDPKRILTVSETASGNEYGLDVGYLDRMINDLAVHTKNYPPQFDTPHDQQRAIRDVKMLSELLDILIKDPQSPDVEILIRAGLLGSMGHNLDIPGSAVKANTIFLRLLAVSPEHPRGNYMYGNFLGGAGKAKEAISYLEKALSFGISDAEYSLGMAYLFLGDKQKSLGYFETYMQHHPDDVSVGKIIDAIRNGTIERKKSGS